MPDIGFGLPGVDDAKPIRLPAGQLKVALPHPVVESKRFPLKSGFRIRPGAVFDLFPGAGKPLFRRQIEKKRHLAPPDAELLRRAMETMLHPLLAPRP